MQYESLITSGKKDISKVKVLVHASHADADADGYTSLLAEKSGPVSVLGRASLRTLRNVYGIGSPTVGSTSSIRLHI